MTLLTNVETTVAAGNAPTDNTTNDVVTTGTTDEIGTKGTTTSTTTAKSFSNDTESVVDTFVATTVISLDFTTVATAATGEIISEVEGTWETNVPGIVMREDSADGNNDDVVEVNAVQGKVNESDVPCEFTNDNVPEVEKFYEINTFNDTDNHNLLEEKLQVYY